MYNDQENKDRADTVNVLWTGGWDSTYRIVELSRTLVSIQPIYCCDKGRASTEKEKETMNRIREALLRRKETIAEILPVKYIDVSEISENQEITEAYHKICETVKIGSQYEWLARLATKIPQMEIGIEKPHGEYSGCVTVIEKYGGMKVQNGIKILDKTTSTHECQLLLGGFKYPIIEITEEEMVKNIEDWGYKDIMKMIWFCHSPIDEKPCGMCRPCQQKMECNMEFLLPKEAQKRYRRYKRIKRIFGIKIANKAASIYRKLLNSDT